MIAIAVDKRINKNKEVKIADVKLKEIIKNAEYMYDIDSYTVALYPSIIDESEIEYGFHYLFYKINGKLYESILTNSRASIEKLYSNTFIEQLCLF